MRLSGVGIDLQRLDRFGRRARAILARRTAAEIAARVDEAARSFPREQLGISTQCGFASIAAGNPITEEVEEHKLRLVAEVARSVWG